MDQEDRMTNLLRFTRHQQIARLAAVALVGSAAVTGVACARQPGSQAPSTAPAPMQAAGQTGAPIAVNCGPGQQALIRSSSINGQAVSQVDCVAAVSTAPMPAVPAAYAAPAAAPTAVSYPAAVPVQQVSSEVETVRVVERPVYRQAARPASYRTAEYVPERRVDTGRSWKKSALIIGSSAGIGAGVGAATGGKKGALIGAAIGGGGATIWDQITRKR
jgi:hypothetical protein